MNVDAIRNGIVIDHIQAGKGMEIYKFLNLESYGCPVALMMNVTSRQMGNKDIIKVDLLCLRKERPFTFLRVLRIKVSVDIVLYLVARINFEHALIVDP